MRWVKYRFASMDSWEYIKDDDLLALVDYTTGNDYLVTQAVNPRNRGHYSTLTEAKAAALMKDKAKGMLRPLSSEDGYSQCYIDSTN